MKTKYYFDYSATTPVDKEALAAMLPYYKDIYGNSGSLHQYGQRAAKAVDEAREQVCGFLNCKFSEVFFTSGATESNNIALQGMLKSGDHLITTNIEHPAVLEVASHLAKTGVDVTLLPVLSNGIISVKDLEEKIKDNTKLVSIMYVNNEIGTVQPIKEVGELITAKNKNRKNKIYFHVDAVQACNYLNCDVNALGVDFLSLSGHKIYGPKGIGVLFARESSPLKPIVFGGHQERNIRPGTLNVPCIVGLAKAISLLKTKENNNNLIKKLRDKIIKEVMSSIPDTLLNGDPEKRIPGNVNFSFLNAEGESILLMLDMKGIAVSTGSACSSGSLKPSHVLTAIGRSAVQSHGSLRITIGKYTTENEVDFLIKTLILVIKKIRKMAPKLS